MSGNCCGRSNLYPVRIAGTIVEVVSRHRVNVLIGGEVLELDTYGLALEPGVPVIVHREESGYAYVAATRSP